MAAQVAEVQLEAAEFFRALTQERLEGVRSLLITTAFEQQKVLFFEKKPADYLWVVRTGKVRLYKSSADGRLATLETLYSGEAFGAISALSHDQYPVSAEAMADGSAWCLPRNTVLTLLRNEPPLAVEVLRIVSGRLHQAHASRLLRDPIAELCAFFRRGPLPPEFQQSRCRRNLRGSLSLHDC